MDVFSDSYGYSPDMLDQFKEGFPDNWKELVRLAGRNMLADASLEKELHSMTIVQLKEELVKRGRAQRIDRCTKEELVHLLQIETQKDKGLRPRTDEDRLLSFSPEQLHSELAVRGLFSQVLFST